MKGVNFDGEGVRMKGVGEAGNRSDEVGDFGDAAVSVHD